MKRLAAIAVVVALFALPACAQHGGSHGGFSGAHAGSGFSAPRGGFSGGHGFSASAPPSFPGGPGSFARSGPPRFAGSPAGPRVFNSRPPLVGPASGFSSHMPGRPIRSPQYGSSRVPYSGPGMHSVARASLLSSGTSHRMPYHSPNGGDRGDPAWKHGGGWHGGGGVHHHVIYFGVNTWAGFPYVFGWAGSPFWPWWGWNYPILPASWDFRNNDDPPAGNSAASQYPEYMPGPYDAGSPDQAEPQQPEYTQPESAPAPSAGAAVTLVFKDGRPNEQIHNYMLTSTTLSILDQSRRDIPVDQLDLPATARMNRDAGIEFSLPGGGR